jgi:Asp-tRNA(Asn)/Glu-tRNA(Gln) amidotransferase A subunit family amidase
VDAPFAWNADLPISKLRIGFVKPEFEPPPPGTGGGRGGGRGGRSPEEIQKEREAQLKILNDALEVYRSLGATLVPVELPAARLSNALTFILSVEAAAAFDDLTRSDDIRDDSLGSWPNSFRTHRFVPAVEYIRAQRARTLLIQQTEKLMESVDAFLTPAPGSASLGLTNLTGHPAVAMKAGFHDNAPVMLMVTGRLYDEATMLRVALAFERATRWHTMHPVLDT